MSRLHLSCLVLALACAAGGCRLYLEGGDDAPTPVAPDAGPDIPPSPPPPPPPPPLPPPSPSPVSECTRAELHIVGIHEAGPSDGGTGRAPARVHIERPGSHILVLSAYQATHWLVSAGPQTEIERIILNGYRSQSALGPAGVPVQLHTFEQTGEFWEPRYEWSGEEELDLVELAEEFTGRPFTSFHGCHRMSDFSLGEYPGGEPKYLEPLCETLDGSDLSSVIGTFEPTADDFNELYVFSVEEPLIASGEITIELERPGRTTLVLSSRRSAKWRVVPRQGAMIERIILNGQQAQEILEAPPGARIEVLTDEQSGEHWPLGYQWPDADTLASVCEDHADPAQCDTWAAEDLDWRAEIDSPVFDGVLLVEQAQAATGLILSAFHGCEATEFFALGEDRSILSFCTTTGEQSSKVAPICPSVVTL